MTEVASAYVTLLPSAKGFEGKLAREIGSPTQKVGEQAGTRFASGMRTSLLGSAKGLVGIIGGAFAAAKIGHFFGDAIEGASDLSESANAVSVTFGKADKAIFQFARSAPRRLGQTELAARNAATTFGAFGKSAGLTGKELADFSLETTTLASDLASFKNTSPEEAIEAIGAALRGEAEPIRKYNVLLDDATLRNRALKLGLIETTKDALTPQQKVLAAHAEIMAQTSDAQGDFARTSDGLANQQRILDARLDQVKNRIGKALLPITTDLVHFLNREGVPAFGDFARFLVNKAIPAIADTAEDVKPLAKELLPALGDALGVARDILKEAVPLVTDFVGAFNSLPGGVKKAIAAGGIAGALAFKVKGSNFGKLLGGAIPSKPIPVFVVNNGIGGGDLGGDGPGGKGRKGKLAGAGALAAVGLVTTAPELPFIGDNPLVEGKPGATMEQIFADANKVEDALRKLGDALNVDTSPGFLSLKDDFAGLDEELSRLLRSKPAETFLTLKDAAKDAGVPIRALTKGLPFTQSEVRTLKGEIKLFGGVVDHSDDATRLLMQHLTDLGERKVIPVVDVDTAAAEAKIARLTNQLAALAAGGGLGATPIPDGIRNPDLDRPNNPLTDRDTKNIERAVERGAQRGVGGASSLTGALLRMGE